MRYAVLATDYDGTLATQGHVDAPTLAALEEVRQSGRKLILAAICLICNLSFPGWTCSIALFSRMAPCSTLPKQSRSDCFASLRRVTCKRPFANAACHSQRGVEFSPLGNRIRQQYWRRFTILATISRSSSIRARSWCCHPAETRPAGLKPR